MTAMLCHIRGRLAAGIVGGLLLVGCSSDPIGVWSSREELPNGERNELELFESEGDSELTMYGQLDKFVGLINLNFEMDCVYDDELEHLDCEAKAPWEGYGFFEFEPQEE